MVYDDNTTEDVTASATWASLTSSRATVTSSGLVTALKPGVVTIRARYRGR
jgi:hypothetical protein